MNKDELKYYYAMYQAMEGIRLDADAEESEENNREEKSGGAGTHIPYGLCKAEGIDVPNGTKPSGAWKLLEGKTGVSAEEVFKKIKDKGTPKQAFEDAKTDVESKEMYGGEFTPADENAIEEQLAKEAEEKLNAENGENNIEDTDIPVASAEGVEPAEAEVGEPSENVKLNQKDFKNKIKEITSQEFDPIKALTDTDSTKSQLEDAVKQAEDGIKIHLNQFEGTNGKLEGTFEKKDLGWVSEDTGELISDSDVAEGIYFNHYYSGNDSYIPTKINGIEDAQKYLEEYKTEGGSKEDLVNVLEQLPKGTVIKDKYGNEYYKGDKKIYDGDGYEKPADFVTEYIDSIGYSDKAETLKGLEESIDGFEGIEKTYEFQKELSGKNHGTLINDGEDIWKKTWSGYQCITDPNNPEKTEDNLKATLADKLGLETLSDKTANIVKMPNGEYASSKPKTLEELNPVLNNLNNMSGYKIGSFLNNLDVGSTIDVDGKVYTYYGNGIWSLSGDAVQFAPTEMGHKLKGYEDGEVKSYMIDLPDVSDDEILIPGGDVIKKNPQTVEEIESFISTLKKMPYTAQTNNLFINALENVPDGFVIKADGHNYKKENGNWFVGKKEKSSHYLASDLKSGYQGFSVTPPKVAAEGGKHTESWLKLKIGELEKKSAQMPDGDEKNALQSEIEGYKNELAPKLEKKAAKAAEKKKQALLSSLEEAKANIQNQYDSYKEKYEASKKEVYEGIWKEPVTIEDYEEKKSSIEAKKEYFQNKANQYQKEWSYASSGSDAEKEASNNWQKAKEMLALVEKYETNAQALSNYEAKCEQFEKKIAQKDAQIEDVNNGGTGKIKFEGGQFEDEAYSQERLDNAMWAKSSNEADKRLRDVCSNVWKGASFEQRKAIYDYTASYNDTNETLRGFKYGEGHGESAYIGPDNIDWSKCGNYNYNGKTSADIANKVENITNLIDKSSYKFDMWVQRGIQSSLAEYLMLGKIGSSGWEIEHMSESEIADAIGVNEGRVFTEYAFASCGTAKGTGFKDKDVILNIYCPAGTKMMYAEPFSYYGHGTRSPYWDGESGQSTFGNESEILLQQGTSMRPTKVSKAHGKIYIDVEVVAQNPVHPDMI